MSRFANLVKPRRLALIPARGGSIGLPGKNLASVGGASLTARVVRCAIETGLFDYILLSTDDALIADEGRRHGAQVPWLRSPELASDTAAVLDTVRDSLCRLQEAGLPSFDVVVLLEPTSPLRTVEIVKRTVAAAESDGVDAALSVSAVPVHYHPRKQFKLDTEGFATLFETGRGPVVNRQELDRTFIRNGMCYVTRTTALAAGAGIFGTRLRTVLVSGPVVNIDAPEDLALARQILEP